MISFSKSHLLMLVFVFNACGGGGDDNGKSPTPQNNLNNNNPIKNEIVSQKKGLGALIPTEEILLSIPVALPPVSAYTSDTLPSSFDLSNKMPPVRSQGQQGSCASWAVGYYIKGYHEHLDKDSTYGTENDYSGAYSPAFLYNSLKLDSSCDGGTYINANLKRVKNIGIAPWKDMPYDEKKCNVKPSSTALSHAKCNKLLDYQRIRTHKPIENIEMQDMKYYLSHGNPLVIGIRVYGGFSTPKQVSGEFIYDVYEEKSYSGGHAIVVVGYDDSKNAFKIINSWGDDWGNSGFLWIDYDVFSRIVFVAYRTSDVLNECEEGSSYIAIDQQKLLFNTKVINSSSKKSFTISNSGSESFMVTDITVPDGYSVDWKNGTLQVGEKQKVTVTFSPTEDKSYNGKISIEHNADQGNSDIELVAEGIDNSNPNLVPIANAGEDITVKVGESVTLDASKSSDDGEIISYEWKSGDTLLSSSKIFIKSDFTVGIHRVTLKIRDDKGLTSVDTITITVINKSNFPPIADAGDNISVSFGESVLVDGSKSKDNDGKIVKYQWKEGNKVLSNSSKFSKKDFSEGKHTLTLIVTDDKGATDKDIIIVTVIYPMIIAINYNNSISKNTLYSINLQTGKSKLLNTIRFDGNSWTSSTFVSDSKYIYILSSQDTLYKVDASTGKVFPKVSLEVSGIQALTVSSNIIIGMKYDETISKNSLYSINPQTGKSKLLNSIRFDGNSWTSGTFISDSKYIYILSSQDTLYKVDASTGKVFPKVSLEVSGIQALTVSSNIIIGMKYDEAISKNSLYSINPQTGKSKLLNNIRFDGNSWTIGTFISDLKYIYILSNQNTLYQIDASTGKIFPHVSLDISDIQSIQIFYKNQ